MKPTSLAKTLSIMRWHLDGQVEVSPSELKLWIEDIEQFTRLKALAPRMTYVDVVPTRKVIRAAIEAFNTGHRSGQSKSDKDLGSRYCRCGYLGSNCVPIEGFCS